MPTKAPARVMYNDVNWSGFYIGAHGGAGYDRDRIGFVGSTEGANTNFAGVLGGGQIGYNYQLANRFVLGLEGDVSWADLKGGRTCGTANGLGGPNAAGFGVGIPTGAFNPFFQTCNTGMDWIATATGKLGYSWDRTLYYLKGGVAFTDETVTVNCIVGPLNGAGSRQCNNHAGAIFNTLSTSASRTGWTLGFGAEFALNANWSAKAEYDYVSFGSRTGLASDGTADYLPDRRSDDEGRRELSLQCRTGGRQVLIPASGFFIGRSHAAAARFLLTFLCDGAFLRKSALRVTKRSLRWETPTKSTPSAMRR